MKLYVGMHQPSDAGRLPRACVSVQRLWDRKSDFHPNEWILDSGAFSEIHLRGGYDRAPKEYAEQIRRWSICGDMRAAVSQDYPCEDFALRKTGHTLAEHQAMTIDRYDALLDLDLGDTYLMPVLQGFLPSDYLSHLEQYGSRISSGQWVGVGSVCKRNGKPSEALAIIREILSADPSLRLHGFGLQTRVLRTRAARKMLFSADSMAWSFQARKQGRDGNSWREAVAWASRATEPLPDLPLFKDDQQPSGGDG